jgi:hypothetical protein
LNEKINHKRERARPVQKSHNSNNRLNGVKKDEANMNDQSISRKRIIAGRVLIFVVGSMLCASAGAKFAHVAKVVEEFDKLGFYGIKLNVVAVLEVLSAVLFLIPFTRSLGLLLVSSYLGGAIATHVQHNQSPFGPSVILGLMWFGSWLRHPAILWSFWGRRSPAVANSAFA